MKEKRKNKKHNNNMKIFVIVGIIIGAIFSITTSYILADTLINSKDVYYQDNSSLGAYNVQAAIDGTCTKFSSQLTNLKTEILNETYPVGSVYTSVVDTSPATLFGGTWEQLEDRFLLGAGTTYTAGATGGEATHTLTVAEMPSHTHNTNVTLTYAIDYGPGSGSRYKGYVNPEWKDFSHTYVTTATGGNAAHNNMPPYLVVYMWKRTK